MTLDAVAANRAAWNAVTPVHNAHKLDQAGYLASGGSTLFDEERALLGDLAGADVLHLMCNCGQDTLSMAAMGARVTGIDLSDVAIAQARALAQESGLPGRFVRAEVFEGLSMLPVSAFDVVFLSYGALGWIDDVGALFAAAARVLRPSGRLVVVEFHPLVDAIADDGKIDGVYGGPPIVGDEGVGDYVGASGAALAPSGFVEAAPEAPTGTTVWFPHTTASLLQGVLDAGLALSVVREWCHSNGWRPFPGLVGTPDRRYRWPEDGPVLPLMLGFVAVKPG
ncbi:MAG: hypothetical protein RLZZ383_1742 [Pseudomonadota bacterium]|jgi:SAM-dependent methyltransferase